MANNVTLTGAGSVTYTFRTTDVGGVHYQHILDGASQSVSILVVAVGTSTAAPAIPSDTTVRVRTIQNVGATAVEISPVAGFAQGAGFILYPNGGGYTTNYNGNWYSRVTTGSGNSEIRVVNEG